MEWDLEGSLEGLAETWGAEEVPGLSFALIESTFQCPCPYLEASMRRKTKGAYESLKYPGWFWMG